MRTLSGTIAALLGFTLWGVPSSAAQLPDVQPRVQIMELSAEPEAGVPEFVELLIAGASPLGSDRLAIRDNRPTWRTLPFDVQPLLPGERVVLTSDSLALRLAYGALPAPARVMEVRPWPALNNDGDSLLVSIDGRVVERAGYHGPAVPRGFTAERISPEVAAHAPFNWRASATAGGTPGSTNAAHELDRTPPDVIGAERDGENRVLLWMNEAMWPNTVAAVFLNGRPVNVSVPDNGLSGSTRLEVLMDAPLAGNKLQIEGIRDPSGNVMLSATVLLARPATTGDVLITEVMTRGTPDWVEISVAETVDAPISMRRVLLNTPSSTAALSPPDSTLLLAPGASTVVSVDLSSTGLGLLLSAVDETGTLVRLDSVRMSPGDEDPRFADHRDRSMVRIGGGARDWASSTEPPSSPGLDTGRDIRRRAPPIPSPGSAVMTEVMFDPMVDPDDGHPDQTEFVEWTMEAPVDLYGAYLTYGINERGATDTLRIGYQATRLATGETVVLASIPSHVSDDPDAPLTFLREAWPDTPIDVRLVPTRAALGLRNAGRRLTLHARDGTILGDDTYTEDMHHPDLPETKGISLSRNGTGRVWGPLYSSSAPGGATPGYTDITASAEREIPADHRAWLAPASIYPRHPELGAQTLIALEPANPSTITSAVYDLEGRAVRQLSRERYVNGPDVLSWDGRDDSGNVVRAGLFVVFVRFSGASTRAFKLPVAVLVR